MPERMNSGRVSTFQTFLQVGKKPKSTQLSVPIPSPSSAARVNAGDNGGEVEHTCSSKNRMIAGEEQGRDTSRVRKSSRNLAKTASSGVTTG